MDTDEEYIIAYIRGQLAANEMTAAELRFREDSSFREAVQSTRLMMELAKMSHADHVVAQVQLARARHASNSTALQDDPPPMRPVWRRKWFWGLAAGLLLLGIVGGVWGLRRPFSGHVYDEVYAPPVIEGQMLGAGGQPAEGYRLYAQGAYHDALPKLLEVRSGDVAQDSAQFFAGICEMEMGQFPEAIHRLRALRAGMGTEATTVLAKGIRWYLGLALWHEGEVDAALPFLRETADDAAAPQRAAARRVLQFIDP